MNAFSAVKVTCYDPINMIHDVIRTGNPFLYTTKLMFVSYRNNKTDLIRR